MKNALNVRGEIKVASKRTLSPEPENPHEQRDFLPHERLYFARFG